MFSFVSLRNRCIRATFQNAGLRPTTTDLGDGTVMHCWAPRARSNTKPNLLLIHGLGSDATWQWAPVVGPLSRHFNVYVPDLVFFGNSRTTRPDRTESFQAECVAGMMAALGVEGRLRVVGLSYGGFVAYAMAARFGDAVVERVVVCCAAVCMEERDVVEGRFKVADLEAAADILLPQTPEKLKELINFTLVNPPKFVPTCFLMDFIREMYSEHLEERRELIRAIPRDRKISEIPRITQPTLIIWGDKDQVFPLEFGYRLQRHIGDNAKLVVIKNAGHAFNVERSKEFYKHLKEFLIDPPPPSRSTCLSTCQNGK